MNISISEIMKAANVAKSVAKLLGVVESTEGKIDALLESEYKAGMTALEQAMSSTTEQESLLREARGRFNKAIHLEKKLRLGFSLLGLSVCHQLLGDQTNAELSMKKITGISTGFFGSFINGTELKALQDGVYDYFGEKSPWILEQELQSGKKKYFDKKKSLENVLRQHSLEISSAGSIIIKDLNEFVEKICGQHFDNLAQEYQLRAKEVYDFIQYLKPHNYKTAQEEIFVQIQKISKEYSSHFEQLLRDIDHFLSLFQVVLETFEKEVLTLTASMKTNELILQQDIKRVQRSLLKELEKSNLIQFGKNLSETRVNKYFKTDIQSLFEKENVRQMKHEVYVRFVELSSLIQTLEILMKEEMPILTNYFLSKFEETKPQIEKSEQLSEHFDHSESILDELFDVYDGRFNLLSTKLDVLQKALYSAM